MATALATRRQVSSIVRSIGSPAMGPFAGPFSRYFMSQICCEIEATTGIGAVSSAAKLQFSTAQAVACICREFADARVIGCGATEPRAFAASARQLPLCILAQAKLACC